MGGSSEVDHKTKASTSTMGFRVASYAPSFFGGGPFYGILGTSKPFFEQGETLESSRSEVLIRVAVHVGDKTRICISVQSVGSHSFILLGTLCGGGHLACFKSRSTENNRGRLCIV